MDPLLLSRVEDAGLNASAPPEQRWLDGWLLRFCPGTAKRARCINAVAEGRLPLPERLRLAEAAYREHGLPMLVRVTPFTQPPALDDTLAGQGWARFDNTRVMVLPDLAATLGAPPGAAGPTTAPQPVTPPAYAHVVGALRGSTAAQCQAHARRLQAAPVPFHGLVWRDGDAVLACAQVAVEGELAGLYDVFTAPAARGRGLATALCHRLLQFAAGRGVRHAYLQVDAGNAAAIGVYARLGFRDAYGYHYRTPDPEQV